MLCENCGAENRDDAKFCTKCGVALPATSTDPLTKMNSGRRGALGFVAVALVLTAIIGSFIRRGGVQPPTGAQFQDYQEVQESIEDIEKRYRNGDGFHDSDRVAGLLDEVEQYGLENPDLVLSVDRGYEYVEFRLADGTLYEFMPSIEGLKSGGVDCSIVTLEPWWTDVEGITSLRFADSDYYIDGFTDTSWYDIVTNSIAEDLDEYTFTSVDNVNDDDVSVERFRLIGRNQFVLYNGHGGAPTKSHGPTLSTRIRVTEDVREEYAEEFATDKVISTNGFLSITDKFFNRDDFAADAFANSDFVLLACYSCKDTRLADALIGLGARTVTGYTESVMVGYDQEMLSGVLGFHDETDGLLSVGHDGQYLTFAESIRNAQSLYGEYDTYKKRGRKAKLVCYPEDVSERARLSDTLVAYLDGDKKAAVNFVQVWYDDWTFEDGHDVQNSENIVLRCLPLINSDSTLSNEFVEGQSMTGKYSRPFAACVVETPKAVELSPGVFRVSVRYLATQSAVDEEMYYDLLGHPDEDVWDVTVDKDNMVISLERANISEGQVDDTDEGTENDESVEPVEYGDSAPVEDFDIDDELAALYAGNFDLDAFLHWEPQKAASLLDVLYEGDYLSLLGTFSSTRVMYFSTASVAESYSLTEGQTDFGISVSNTDRRTITKEELASGSVIGEMQYEELGVTPDADAEEIKEILERHNLLGNGGFVARYANGTLAGYTIGEDYWCMVNMQPESDLLFFNIATERWSEGITERASAEADSYITSIESGSDATLSYVRW